MAKHSEKTHRLWQLHFTTRPPKRTRSSLRREIPPGGKSPLPDHRPARSPRFPPVSQPRTGIWVALAAITMMFVGLYQRAVSFREGSASLRTGTTPSPSPKILFLNSLPPHPPSSLTLGISPPAASAAFRPRPQQRSRRSPALALRHPGLRPPLRRRTISGLAQSPRPRAVPGQQPQQLLLLRSSPAYTRFPRPRRPSAACSTSSTSLDRPVLALRRSHH